ncbi:uncharacterized protein LOC100821144 [Brachypodium distachyon]|uniref:CRIB domain-containing protein n=1 Tax=Brachypodium distachyon TaxID=15368 RepID=I1ILR6_BRADI|nr:uncharacterized protein LOC100821144 [Brachypodium distachyon]KQJ88522.1 hypothetical protein BRADI_4g19080v3 [Brachypodium distachyon]|eukprot:XP_003577568.1 uncharacterized protein LOC100821144 [Brachypodium distachyon]
MTSIVDAPVQGAAATTRDHEEAAAAEDVARKAAAAEQEAASRRDVFLLAGIRKLIKSFRSLSHIFEIYKDDGDEDDDEDDIQIGFPTDVQHVAHIGLDGSSSSNVAGLIRGREEAGASCRELLSLSTNLSLEQFEFAMASLAAHRDQRSAVLEDRAAARN